MAADRVVTNFGRFTMRATTTDPTVALALWPQVHDSAFPAGRMVHSHGLEEWLRRGPTPDAGHRNGGVVDYLAYGYAPLDATITAAAWRASRRRSTSTALDELTSSLQALRKCAHRLGIRWPTTGPYRRTRSAWLNGNRTSRRFSDGNDRRTCRRGGGRAAGALGVDRAPRRARVAALMLASMLSAAVRLAGWGRCRASASRCTTWRRFSP